MNKTIRWGMSAGVAVLALVLNYGVASAQQKAPDAVKDVPKATTPPKDVVKPGAPAKATAPAKDAVKPPVPKKAAAPVNPCTPLKDEAGCTAVADCAWTKETTVTKGPQAGKKRAAYCHKKPVVKTPAAVKAPAPKAAAPAPAPKAVAPAAPAPAPAPKAPAPAPKN